MVEGPASCSPREPRLRQSSSEPPEWLEEPEPEPDEPEPLEPEPPDVEPEPLEPEP